MIVLDANILIRAVLGARTHDLIERYAGKVSFVAPRAVFSDAEKYVPGIHAQRSPSESLFQFRMENSAAVFSRLSNWVAIAPEEKLLAFKDAANQRFHKRDPNDVPILAAAQKFFPGLCKKLCPNMPSLNQQKNHRPDSTKEPGHFVSVNALTGGEPESRSKSNNKSMEINALNYVFGNQRPYKKNSLF